MLYDNSSYIFPDKELNTGLEVTKMEDLLQLYLSVT